MTGNELRLILQPIFGYHWGWKVEASKALFISYPHFTKMVNNQVKITARTEREIMRYAIASNKKSIIDTGE